MSNHLASQSLSTTSNQMGQLEPISNRLDSSLKMGLMGSGTSGSLQQVSVTNMQVGAVGQGYSVSASQQMPVSSMQMGFLLPMSNNAGSEILRMSDQQTFKMESQAYNLVQQQFFLPNKQMREVGTMPNNLASQPLSLLNKRKASMEPVSNNSVPQKLLLSNKRVSQPQHRPWLQQTSGPDRRVAQQMQFMPNSPGSQNSPAVNKKVVPKESATSKPGPRKQSISKSQNTPLQPLPKAKTESFESVRSKMRESLASALALVSQQQDKSLKEEKNDQNEAQNILRDTEENSLTAASTVSVAVDPVSAGCKETLHSQEDSSNPICLDSQNASQGYFANENISNSSQISKPNGQEFQYGNFLPDEDVPFGDNFFVRDELLQGNGLSWVLEPMDVTVSEIPAAVNQESWNEQVGGDRDGGEQQLDQSPQFLAFKIEAELFKLFGGVNKKYKEKGRSLLFNLKDPNNPELRERVMSGEIPPERLCAMSAEELASEELSQWRMAKAEELAQMVVLPDEVDTRRLVKKTHKGEVQVEVEQVDAASADVSVGASSLAQVSSKTNTKEASSSSSKPFGMKDESNTAAADRKSNLEEQEGLCSIASPSNEGTDLMEGLMVDNELKDAEFLPPIVSLDEFMESLNKEPPFENLSVDAEKSIGTLDKDDSEAGSESKSPVQTPADPVDSTPARPDSVDLKIAESKADAKPSDSPVKSVAAPSSFVPKGELVWDGLLQLNISAMASAVGIFKSGEKTCGKDWANLLEIKGRVRLQAFEKFLQELPMSRSRAVMILHFVGKEASPKNEHASLSEVADSYVLDGRVGYAEAAPGIEVYFCPPHTRTREMLSKILPNDQLEALNAIDNGLIGVVVWRKAQLPSTISPNSAASHHKHTSKKQHLSSRRHQDKNTNMNVNISPKPSSISQARPPSVYAKSTQDEDDDDDDVPPGFGPLSGGRDDDDLPEFNFSGGSTPNAPRGVGMTHFHPHPHTQSRPVDQMRELILKYGQPQGSPSLDRRVGIQAWNNDDDDDIPEWQPQAPQNQPSHHHPMHAYQRTNIDNQHGHQLFRQSNAPQMNVLQSQQNASSHLWSHGQYGVPSPVAKPPVCQPGGVQSYGAGQPGVPWRQDAPKSRGF